MTDTALVNANKRRDSLAAEINSLAQHIDDLKRDLAEVDAWIAQWREFAGIPLASVHDNVESVGTARQREVAADGNKLKRRRATRNPKKEDVAEVTRQIIQERGEPVSRADLFKALSERGINISSESDPKMVLSTMLWRVKGKVVRLRTGGYWLPERPYPKAGYDPNLLNETVADYMSRN